MKKLLLPFGLILSMSACSTVGDDRGDGGWLDQRVQTAAGLYVARHGGAQSQPMVYLGWREVFSRSRGNETCGRVIRGLGRWPDQTVCRQSNLAGVGQVLFLLTERQKNYMRDCKARLWFEYKPGASGMMPVYQAMYSRHHRHHGGC